MSISRKYYSQFGQDLWVFGEVFDEMKRGYFVEIGSADGITYNNTFLLESKYNWNGLCIEANPDLFKTLAEHRRVKCLNLCVDSQNDQTKYALNWLNSGIVSNDTDNNEQNSNKFIYVETHTLLSIFERENVPEVIDYLSIDVEGAEERILKDFPFEKYKFNCITIERPSKVLRELLKFYGYIQIKEIPGLDVFYVHTTICSVYTENVYRFYQKNKKFTSL